MNGIWSMPWLLFSVMSNIPKMGQANQPLQEDEESIEVANLQQQLAAAAARCKDSALLKKAMDQLLSWATAPRAPIRGHVSALSAMLLFECYQMASIYFPLFPGSVPMELESGVQWKVWISSGHFCLPIRSRVAVFHGCEFRWVWGMPARGKFRMFRSRDVCHHKFQRQQRKWTAEKVTSCRVVRIFGNLVNTGSESQTLGNGSLSFLRFQRMFKFVQE